MQLSTTAVGIHTYTSYTTSMSTKRDFADLVLAYLLYHTRFSYVKAYRLHKVHF